jgi:SPP1 gp7 family putative phage head morphogenesis protein
MAVEDRYRTMPFESAIAYMQGKINLDSDKWDDISASEHDAAFISAGIKGSVLSDLHSAVNRGIESGQTLEDFTKTFKLVTDGYVAPDLQDWRAQIVYQTNANQAYRQGRVQQQLDPEVQKLQPYLEYVHGDTNHPRPHHLALDGKVFRADAIPWFPPVGFGCQCRTIARSDRYLKQHGIEVSDIQVGDTVKYRDDRNIEREVEIKPDKGFDPVPKPVDAARRRALIDPIIARAPEAIAKQIKEEIERVDTEFASTAKELVSPPEKAQKSEYEQARADLDLLQKLYGKESNQVRLTKDERSRLEELELQAGKIKFTDLKAAREREFALRQKASTEIEAGKPIPQGPMSVAEANAALSDSERKALKAILDPPEGRNFSQGRLDLASSRDMAETIARSDKVKGLGLSVEDIQALRNYTANGYVGVNGALRGLQDDPTSQLAQQQRLVARAANQALAKLPEFQGEVRRDTVLSKAELESLEVGQKLSMKGITSTSTNLSGSSTADYGKKEGLNKTNLYSDIAQRGGIKSGQGSTQRVTFTIETDQGRDLGVISTRSFEKEVVLPHGWEGEVKAIKKTATGYEITLSDKGVKRSAEFAESDSAPAEQSEPLTEERELYLIRQTDALTFEIVR